VELDGGRIDRFSHGHRGVYTKESGIFWVPFIVRISARRFWGNLRQIKRGIVPELSEV
jgi:hypothetical protein